MRIFSGQSTLHELTYQSSDHMGGILNVQIPIHHVYGGHLISFILTLQHDNDPRHTAGVIKNYLLIAKNKKHRGRWSELHRPTNLTS